MSKFAPAPCSFCCFSGTCRRRPVHWAEKQPVVHATGVDMTCLPLHLGDKAAAARTAASAAQAVAVDLTQASVPDIKRFTFDTASPDDRILAAQRRTTGVVLGPKAAPAISRPAQHVAGQWAAAATGSQKEPSGVPDRTADLESARCVADTRLSSNIMQDASRFQPARDLHLPVPKLQAHEGGSAIPCHAC